MINLPQGDYLYKGTVLKQNRDTEALLVFLLDLGKTWIFVQGRGHNRFLGAAEPMVWGEFNIYKNTRGLFLKNINVKNDFLSLRQDATALYLATRIYSITADKLPFEIKNNSLLQSLYDTLILIAKGASGEATYLRFIAKFLTSYGVMPSLKICSNCGSVIQCFAQLSDHGVLCNKCSSTNGLILDAKDLIDVHKAIYLGHNDFVAWCKSTCSMKTLGACADTLAKYFEQMK